MMEQALKWNSSLFTSGVCIHLLIPGMLLPALILFFFFLILSAFFSSSETAFIASNPYKLKYLEKKGNKNAKLVRKMTAKVDNLLAQAVAIIAPVQVIGERLVLRTVFR